MLLCFHYLSEFPTTEGQNRHNQILFNQRMTKHPLHSIRPHTTQEYVVYRPSMRQEASTQHNKSLENQKDYIISRQNVGQGYSKHEQVKKLILSR
jgi:hypothetical protein